MRPDSFHARILNNKRLPRFFKFAILIFTNWLFHGFLYMDRTEKAFYLLLDGLFFLPIFFAFSTILNPNSSVFLAFVITHTLHWVFDGHLFVLFKNLGLSKAELKCFVENAKELRERVRKKRSILAVAIFGSLSRGSLIESSDLDVRIIRRPGMINGLKACGFAFLERSRAFLKKFPLDLYVIDNPNKLSKIRPDEAPIVLYDPPDVFRKKYSHVDDFDDALLEKKQKIKATLE